MIDNPTERATQKQMIAVKTIARNIKDWDKTFWSTVYMMSKKEASDYIEKNGNNLSFRKG